MTRPLLAAVALMFALPLFGGCASQSAPVNSSTPRATASQADISTSWALHADQSASAAQAGLPMLDHEMLDVHYHAHIDLVVRGERVPIPAGVGIDAKEQRISPLHTHDVTGIVHIESAEDIPFTLGQFFTEWGQPLDAVRIGPAVMTEGERLRVYRDGKEVTGDPASIRFARHAEFYLWVGPADSPPSPVPSTFDFPKGL